MKWSKKAVDTITTGVNLAMASMDAHKDDPKLVKAILQSYMVLCYFSGYDHGYKNGQTDTNNEQEKK